MVLLTKVFNFHYVHECCFLLLMSIYWLDRENTAFRLPTTVDRQFNMNSIMIIEKRYFNLGATKIQAEETPQKILEGLFDLQWHSYIALGVFVGVYLKCTSASIPSGDAGELRIKT